MLITAMEKKKKCFRNIIVGDCSQWIRMRRLKERLKKCLQQVEEVSGVRRWRDRAELRSPARFVAHGESARKIISSIAQVHLPGRALALQSFLVS